MMKIAIIEDEKLTAKDLAKTIKAVEPDAEILPFLYSVEDAISFFKQKPEVDLIFSDIELGDGLSFEIFQKTAIQTPIIFCTAYQQYTLEAFKTLGIDYILKPFSKSTIEKTLLKYKSLKSNFSKSATDFELLIAEIKTNLQAPANPSVIVHLGDKIIPINGTNVALFFIENESTYAYTFEQKKLLVSQKLDALEKTFSPAFFRANRQVLINRKAVKDASQFFNRKMVANITIPFHEQIIIGKLKTTEFIKWLAEN
jgi:two-component system response regulator LytT